MFSLIQTKIRLEVERVTSPKTQIEEIATNFPLAPGNLLLQSTKFPFVFFRFFF
jgi:hypothetical protein